MLDNILLGDAIKLEEGLYRTDADISRVFEKIRKAFEYTRDGAHVYFKVKDIVQLTTHKGERLVTNGPYYWGADNFWHDYSRIWLAVYRQEIETVVEKILGPIHRALGVNWTMKIGEGVEPDVDFYAELPHLKIIVGMRQVEGCRWEPTGEYESQPAPARPKMRLVCDDQPLSEAA